MSIARDMVKELMYNCDIESSMVQTHTLKSDRVYTFSDDSVLDIEINGNEYTFIIKGSD